MVAVVLAGCDSGGGSYSRPIPDVPIVKPATPVKPADCVLEGAQAATEYVVSEQLVAPASAVYGPIEVLARDGQRIFTRVRVDSQNRLGAMLRGWWCASVQFDQCPTTKIHYSKLTGVTMCDEPPTARELQAVMALDGWPGVTMPASDRPKRAKK